MDLSRDEIKVLQSLESFDEAKPAHQIIDAYKERHGEATDPSTIHRTFSQLEDLDLVGFTVREVDVPGPYKSVERAERSVYYLTNLGHQVLKGETEVYITLSSSSFWAGIGKFLLPFVGMYVMTKWLGLPGGELIGSVAGFFLVTRPTGARRVKYVPNMLIY